MLNEIILMRPNFFAKYQAKREQIEKEISYIEEKIKQKADDLDAQFKRVFNIEGKIAKINITGPLSPDGPDWIDVYLGYGGTAYKNIIRAAMEAKSLFDSDQIEKVIIKMNTPGGRLDQLDFAYQALQSISEIGEVVNNGMIASAGVWLASAFEKIYPATDSAQIGSIGVGITYFEDSQYYSNFGIEKIEITNKESPNKWPDVLTKEGAAVIRRELDDLYNVFVSKVTAARPITKKDIDSLKGEMLIASKAIKFGLMDKPLNGEIPISADNEKNNNEMEVSEMPKKIIVTEETPADGAIIDLVTPAIEAERTRLYGLAVIAGIEISEELKKAIDTGITIGDFALAQVEATNAKEKAEIEAAKKLRKNNPDQKITGINSDELGRESEKETEAKKIDNIVDEDIKRIKGIGGK